MQEDINYFIEISRSYLPKKITYLFIAECLPNDKENFFYYTGIKKGNYMFFQNMMLAIYGTNYKGEYDFDLTPIFGPVFKLVSKLRAPQKT